jgi:acetolactate synthase regulatory subunit
MRKKNYTKHTHHIEIWGTMDEIIEEALSLCRHRGYTVTQCAKWSDKVGMYSTIVSKEVDYEGT